MGIAFGAAAFVAVPLALFLGWNRSARHRRHRLVSERRRAQDTRINLVEAVERKEERSRKSRHKSSRRRRRTHKPSIDLFKTGVGEESGA